MKHILFDLDGTLLPMDLQTFTKAYFGSLYKRFAKYNIELNFFVDCMWKGVGAIMHNDGTKTNEEAFEVEFYKHFPLAPTTARQEFESYYETDFPSISHVAHPSPISAEIIKACKAKGFDTVLATSPIFPKAATHERIRWAGLNKDDFAEITTFEYCTFCKPNIEYYKAILSRHGFKPEDCIMVGNDVNEDLVIRKLGVKTFLVEGFIENGKQLPEDTDYRGTLEDLLRFINAQ